MVTEYIESINRLSLRGNHGPRELLRMADVVCVCGQDESEVSFISEPHQDVLDAGTSTLVSLEEENVCYWCA